MLILAPSALSPQPNAFVRKLLSTNDNVACTVVYDAEENHGLLQKHVNPGKVLRLKLDSANP
eukprot:2203496-Amphidinium_carterae.1